ncbi:MAG TPA: hypothetical protein VE619_06980 [Nitrososphaeraceae archaeon]|nr:hypothetical protein [Nitrososphaeraceae archaeon]
MVFIHFRDIIIISCIALSFIVSTHINIQFLAHAQQTKNTNSTMKNSNILPKNTTNNGSHLFKGNITTAAGPNGHKYTGGITTAGVG